MHFRNHADLPHFSHAPRDPRFFRNPGLRVKLGQIWVSSGKGKYSVNGILSLSFGLPDNGHNLQSVCECLDADGISITPRSGAVHLDLAAPFIRTKYLILAGTTSRTDTSIHLLRIRQLTLDHFVMVRIHARQIVEDEQLANISQKTYLLSSGDFLAKSGL